MKFEMIKNLFVQVEQKNTTSPSCPSFASMINFVNFPAKKSELKKEESRIYFHFNSNYVSTKMPYLINGDTLSALGC